MCASISAGALVTVFSQLLLFPPLLKRLGANIACNTGLSVLSGSLLGLSLCRQQPFHSAFYLVNRAGSGVADAAAQLHERLQKSR